MDISKFSLRDRIVAYLRQRSPHTPQRECVTLLHEALDEIDRYACEAYRQKCQALIAVGSTVANSSDTIAAPAVCKTCGIRHTAPTTGRVVNQCSICRGTLVTEATE